MLTICVLLLLGFLWLSWFNVFQWKATPKLNRKQTVYVICIWLGYPRNFYDDQTKHNHIATDAANFQKIKIKIKRTQSTLCTFTITIIMQWDDNRCHIFCVCSPYAIPFYSIYPINEYQLILYYIFNQHSPTKSWFLDIIYVGKTISLYNFNIHIRELVRCGWLLNLFLDIWLLVFYLYCCGCGCDCVCAPHR